MKNYKFSTQRGILTALTLITGAAVVIVLTSFTVLRMAADVWSKLGLTEEVGIGNVQSAFLEGYFYQLNPAAAKKIAFGDRKTVASELLIAARKYVESPAFREDYEWYKNEKRPKPPQPARSEQEIRNDLIAQIRESIQETEKIVKEAGPELKSAFQEGLDMQKQQLSELQDPQSEMVSMFVEDEKRGYEARYQSYLDKVKEFDETYPADMKLMIKDRLNLFLELTEGVDYEAELKTVYGRQVFVNPRYERMHSEWKMAFRCGKDVTETARAFANEWLKSLNEQ